jgi:(2R)-sulfolactate sulfo-lyase subunit beta
MPVIKIAASPKAAVTMAEHIDVDLSEVLRREITLDEAAERIADMMRRTADGRLTAAEVLGHREFIPTKLYRSA